jgi:hypothetical protein
MLFIPLHHFTRYGTGMEFNNDILVDRTSRAYYNGDRYTARFSAAENKKFS